MGQFGILVVEVVHALCKGEYACLRVGGLQGCELNAAEEEFLHFLSVVLRHFLSDNLAYSLANSVVVEVGVVLSESLVVLARLLLLCLLVVEDNVFNDSHCC